MPHIAPDLHRAVVERDVSVRHSVLLVHPMRVQRQIGRKDVLVPLQLFRAFDVEIPAVEYRIQPLRFRQILQRMVADKYPLGIFQLVRQHIERDRAPLLADECVDIQSAVTEIPVASEPAQIVRGRVQQLFYFRDVRIYIPRKIQSDRPRDGGRGEGGAVHHAVSPALLGRIHCPGRHHVRVLAVIGIRRKLPTLLRQRSDTDHVFVRRRITECRCPVVARCRHTDDVAVFCKFRRGGERINIISPEGHIHHVDVLFYRIIQPEYEVGSAVKSSVLVAFGFDDQNFRLRGDAHRAAPVHRRGDHARDRRTVSLFVLYQTPIVRAVIQRIILYDFILCGVVGIFADPARKFGVIGVDARVDDSDGDSAALRIIPRFADVQIVQISLPIVIAVRHGIVGRRR